MNGGDPLSDAPKSWGRTDGEKCIGYRDPPDSEAVKESAIYLFWLMDLHHPNWRRLGGSRNVVNSTDPEDSIEQAIRRLSELMHLNDKDVFADELKRSKLGRHIAAQERCDKILAERAKDASTNLHS